MIANAAGAPVETITDAQLSDFKDAVTSVLSPYASAVLLDPEYGLPAARNRAAGCGLLLTYELDGYDNPRPHKMLALMPNTSVAQLRDLGADAIKILLSWAPDEDERANDQKRAMIVEIGEECEAAGVPFLLEPVVYDPAGGPVRSLAFAKRRPDFVLRTMEEFSRPVYKVDVLKVEFPVLASYVEASSVYAGEKAQSYDEALDWFRRADAVATVPYIYLSAGASIAEFTTSLRMAREAGAGFSGILCGRAMWQDGIPSFVAGGPAGFRGWLASEGVANARNIAECLRGAISLHDRLEGALE
ncbi:MAG: tagatose-bisphosphate aldolase [Bryobacterales bacterium]|nr:tagatose-bisphosphate aldolase [Bryobacterales bacterium]